MPSRPCWHPWLFAGDHFVMIFSSDVIFLLYCINDASFSTNLYILKSTDENASDVLWTWIYNGLWAAIWVLLVLASSALFPSLITGDVHRFSITGPCKIAWSSHMLCYLIAIFHFCGPFLPSIWNLWHPTSSWKEWCSAEPYHSMNC